MIPKTMLCLDITNANILKMRNKIVILVLIVGMITVMLDAFKHKNCLLISLKGCVQFGKSRCGQQLTLLFN